MGRAPVRGGAWVGPIRDRRSPSASGGAGRRTGTEPDATRIGGGAALSWQGIEVDLLRRLCAGGRRTPTGRQRSTACAPGVVESRRLGQGGKGGLGGRGGVRRRSFRTASARC